ncbi:acylneuraminate cytidylyltransferase family protein [Methylomonas sp. SURF-2]|uniref:Acylneuraminate cytidylyltransferase family protein n=1 Tax=Methylomonas subterranea TaxID=2952225 RepID=A0ABT1TBK4_9GAMM|nr:acylneuraminate cytidylyltransferase family protein [Methylomonas sp. SURF-2]MCQ8102838.1 acylneuraminate cytidylyltransferase family protein [Methylomonas sp. SURF-2]
MAIKTLVIVPARSGSKGLKDKNIKLLGGKPLLAWTAEALKAADLDDCLAILSTDSEVYADIGHQAGLMVPFLRPGVLASDTASSLGMIEHALGWYDSVYACPPLQVMLLQPTSPFRSAAIIRQAVSMLAEQQVEAVIGCKELQRDLTTLFRRESGFLQPIDSRRSTQTSRQQIEPLLTPNGAMYLVKTRALLEEKSFYPRKTLPLVMNSIQSLDIDTEEDWAMAEAFIKQGLVS